MTWEELEALAVHNVHVNSWLCLMRNERITREEMLLGLAIHLAGVNDRLMAMLIDASTRATPSVVFLNPPKESTP